MVNKNEFLSQRVRYLPVGEIYPNRQQPRRHFDGDSLQELAQSIRQYGILQPLTVRRRKDGYELIAGERRLRAARLANLQQVPCIIARVEEEDAGMLALIENLQRRDLHYLEEARAIAGMVTRYDLTQEQVAQKLGRSQSAVANKLRLLRLAPEICTVLEQNDLSERHARALLRLSDPQEQYRAVCHAAEKKWNVAQTETYVENRLHSLQQGTSGHHSTYILKDVRLFLNSIRHHVALLQQSGVVAAWEQQDAGDRIIVTVCVAKHGEKVAKEK